VKLANINLILHQQTLQETENIEAQGIEASQIQTPFSLASNNQISDHKTKALG